MITHKKNDRKENKESRIVKMANWTIKWRWPVVIGSLLITILFGYGAKNIGFNSDYRVFFSEENTLIPNSYL